MSDTLLVTTMYAYNAQGAPTFYVGTAPLSASNTATMNLSEPQGGTCFGCTPTNGRLLSSPGSATFEFTSSTQGFVTLPNETRKAIVKGAITRPSGPNAFRGIWAFSYVIDSTLTVADTPSFSILLPATTNGNGLMASADGKTGCELQISGSLAGSVVCIKNTASPILDKAMLLKQFGDRMDGVWFYRDTLSTQYLFTSHRIADATGSSLMLKRAPVAEAVSASDFEALRAAMNNAARELAEMLQ